MHRYIDTFFIILGVFVVSFVICGLLTAKFAVKLAISFAFSLVAVCVLAYLTRGGKRGNADYRSFVTYCLLSEESETAAMLKSAGFLSENAAPLDGFYVADGSAVYLHLKFSRPSADLIVSLYKKCRKNALSRLTVWCTSFERKSVAISCTLPGVEIKFRTLKPLYKSLRKKKLLDGKIAGTASRPSFRTLLPVILSTRNSYRFALAALTLYAFSLLTPLRIYYIVAATSTLVLAIVSRIYGEKI